ncbi:MAG: type II toxin-antitoxin system Phd/YefM family antitoxin [Chloroflexota bacterium]
MIQSWPLQDAKNRLSKLIDDALSLGPQLITRRGSEVAIVLAYSEYQKMIASQEKLSCFFQNSPLAEVELDLSRDKGEIREAFEI